MVYLYTMYIAFLNESTYRANVVFTMLFWIREFLCELNRERKVTVILTTHDMDDIEKICRRLVILDTGHIVYDGSIDLFKKTYGNECEIIIDFADAPSPVSDSRIALIKTEGNRCIYKFNLTEITIAELITGLAKDNAIKDFSYREPDIESLIKRYYTVYSIRRGSES